MLHFLKHWWQFIQIHQYYTMALILLIYWIISPLATQAIDSKTLHVVIFEYTTCEANDRNIDFDGFENKFWTVDHYSLVWYISSWSIQCVPQKRKPIIRVNFSENCNDLSEEAYIFTKFSLSSFFWHQLQDVLAMHEQALTISNGDFKNDLRRMGI